MCDFRRKKHILENIPMSESFSQKNFEDMVFVLCIFLQLVSLKICDRLIFNESTMQIEFAPPEDIVAYRQVDTIIEWSNDVMIAIDALFWDAY